MFVEVQAKQIRRSVSEFAPLIMGNKMKNGEAILGCQRRLTFADGPRVSPSDTFRLRTQLTYHSHQPLQSTQSNRILTYFAFRFLRVYTRLSAPEPFQRIFPLQNGPKGSLRCLPHSAVLMS